MKDRVVINNKKYGPFSMTRHSFEKTEENIFIKVKFESHKIDLSLLIAEIIFQPACGPVPEISGIWKQSPYQ